MIGMAHPTRDEELALVARVRDGDTAAWDEMILRNQGLVVHRANKMLGRGIDFEDLVQQGTLGLIRALKDYDPSKRVKFATYATPWVHVHMQRAIYNQATLIRIPEYYRYRGASPEATASKEAAKVKLIGDGLGNVRHHGPTPARQAAARDDARKLGRMLRALPKTKADVLRLRYGIEGEDQHTVDACAKRLGITRREVRQIETQAMHELARRRA